MKYPKFISYLLVIVSASFFSSCSRESIDYPGSTKQVIAGSSWSIDYYFAGQDKTAQFSNYKFSFVGTGLVTADDGTNTFNGNWSVVTDVNRKDVLRINLSDAHLQDLNNQWTIEDANTSGSLVMKNSASEIHLRKL
ncbi:MAG: hypothetical protein ACXVBH_09850 [Flavisolibacter sp.]